MTRPDALIEARLTVQHWRRRPRKHQRAMRVHISREIGVPVVRKHGFCSSTWDAIEREIVWRLTADDVPLRLAA